MCSISSDEVETRYRWESLTVAFPEIDWRAAFKSAAVAHSYASFAEEVDKWASPCAGEQRIINKLREELAEAHRIIHSLRQPLSH